MASIVVLLCVSWLGLAAAGSAPTYNLEDAGHHFESFIQKHGKTYANEREKHARFQIFKDNLLEYNRLNAKSKHTVFGITRFSDLTREEFHHRHACLGNLKEIQSANCEHITDADVNYNDAPESFDWRDHNAVTPVKDQGNCGSCYAFSAIGNVESQFAIKHKNLVGLSEQQVVDCDTSNSGCGGGFMHLVFRYLMDVGGIETEVDYPYAGIENDCTFEPAKVKVKLSNCYLYDVKSQEKLKQLLYHNGPITIGIQADGIMGYGGGIIMDEICDSGDLNHGVLIVGYGSENGTDYWIVKNSWAEHFGEKGYFRMQRGEGAHSCGMINEFMTVPVVA